MDGMTPIALAFQRVAKLEAELKEVKTRVRRIERELNEARQTIYTEMTAEAMKDWNEPQKRID